MDSESNNQQDKKTQKKSSKLLCLKENEEIGRYYAAGRNLKAGEVVLLEIPISHAPKTQESAFATDKICCFGCNRILNGDQSQPCSKCKLFVCSSTCEKMAVHSENECKIFQNLKDTTYKPTLTDIFYLRTALVKKSKPLEFEKIKNLSCGLPKAGNDLKISNNDAKRVLHCFGLEELLTVDEWLQIANVVNSNKYSSSVCVKPANGEKYDATWWYLSPEASMLAHSCAPNCFMECTPLPEMEVCVRTCTSVKKGEVLSIDYFGKPLFVTTFGRRNANNFFECKCRRCMDPSELGSHLATVVCPECKAMNMMSTDPMVKQAEWKCNSCGTVGHALRNMTLLTELSFEISNMDPAKVGTKPLIERIKKLAGTVLHPNHWIIAQSLQRLTGFLDGRIDSVDPEEFLLYASALQQLISITSIICPGNSHQSARFKFSLASALLMHVTKKKDNIETELEKKLVLQTLARVTELLTEAGKFFEYYVGTCHAHRSETAEDIKKKLQFIEEWKTNISSADVN